MTGPFRIRKDSKVANVEKKNVGPGDPKTPSGKLIANPEEDAVRTASSAEEDGVVTVANSFWTQDPDAKEMTKDGTNTELDRDFVCAPGGNSALLPQAAFYDDPFLIDLINQALVGNQELRILAEEIRIANYETYARSGEYRPFVTGGLGAGIEKPGLHTPGGAVEDQLDAAPGKSFPDPLPNFLVGTQISWELDIWKRLRNAQQAAAVRYLGSREGRNFVVTRLVAEISENYYKLLALDNRLATLEKTIEIQKSSLLVAEAKKNAGRGTELAVRRFEAEVEKNQAERSILQQEIVETENRINFLAGRFPQRVERSSVPFVDLALNELCSGIPSELLQNRADIRQAEREVAATGLDIKVARARFYPSLSLTGGLGWNAFGTGYLFRTPESLVYGVAGDLVGPLINKRAIKAAYSTANAKQLQAIYNYQQTILEAHIEVVNFLTKVENYRRSIEIKKQQLLALEASVDAANNLFQNARAEYVEVLLAQRELMEARMLLIDTKQEQLGAVINAYQALGGGWR
jgi:NodT family efflux transporter outer membrane factor (OMF) lipoprotein